MEWVRGRRKAVQACPKARRALSVTRTQTLMLILNPTSTLNPILTLTVTLTTTLILHSCEHSQPLTPLSSSERSAAPHSGVHAAGGHDCVQSGCHAHPS